MEAVIWADTNEDEEIVDLNIFLATAVACCATSAAIATNTTTAADAVRIVEAVVGVIP